MNSVCSRSSVAGISFVAFLLVSIQAEAGDAHEWLARMNRAVQYLNYTGTFVHVVDGNVETMRIVHRNHNGHIGERIESLDGAGREIIGRNGQLQVIFPNRHVVLFKPGNGRSSVSTAPRNLDKLRASYRVTHYSTARVAGRVAHVVDIEPKDQYRYGYVVWLDQNTAYPLKSQLRDAQHHTIEQILFTQIHFPDSIPKSAINPTIDTDGFTVYRSPAAKLQPMTDVPWKVAALPQGFQLAVAVKAPMGAANYQIEHLVYTDGLATVSVFIEGSGMPTHIADGFARLGNSNAYSMELSGGRHVTVMGEVPKQTVHTIAVSLHAR